MNVGSILREAGVRLQRKLQKQPATHALPAATKALTEFTQPDTELVSCVSDVGDIRVYKRPPAVVLETDDL